VRRFFAFTLKGDWSQLDLLADDLIYRPITEIVGAGEFEEPQRLRGYIEDFESAWSGVTYEPTSIRAHGDTVIVRVELRGRGRRSGLELHARVFQVFTLCAGEIVRIEDFVDHAQALAAAGA
jgi:ketosteroid isomerase-like protein